MRISFLCIITESGFDQWKENEDSGLCAGAAVWRRDGMRRLVSEDTGHGQEAACYQVKGCPEAIFGNALIGGRYFTAGEEGVCLLDQKTAVIWLGGCIRINGFFGRNESQDCRSIGRRYTDLHNSG